jgi:hypothetical protein
VPKGITREEEKESEASKIGQIGIYFICVLGHYSFWLPSAKSANATCTYDTNPRGKRVDRMGLAIAL